MVNIGGLNKDKDKINKRKQCFFCKKYFKGQETKVCPAPDVNPDGLFFHPECWDEYQFKINDLIHLREGK